MNTKQQTNKEIISRCVTQDRANQKMRMINKRKLQIEKRLFFSKQKSYKFMKRNIELCFKSFHQPTKQKYCK